MKPSRPSLHAAGVSQPQVWLGLAMVVAIAAFILLEMKFGTASVYSEDARPRLVAARGELDTGEQVAIKVFGGVSPSVVYITSEQTSGGLFRMRPMEVEKDTASGFVWDPNGYIVTNYHVVANSDSIRVALEDQSTWKAQRVGFNADKDIAVLKIDAPADLLPAIPIGTSHNLQVGQTVFAVGNPFGYDQTMTSGIVSGLGREIKSADDRPITGVIQTDAPMNPGNSGGPLLDSAGRVVGMNTAILSPTGTNAGIGFAIPIDTINRIVPRIIRGDNKPAPRLGITPAPDHMVHRLGLDGVLIIAVAPDTSADAAGLHGTDRNEQGKLVLGDLIVAVDGRPVHFTDDLYAIIDQHKVGDVIRLTIVRQDQKTDVPVKLEPLP